MDAYMDGCMDLSVWMDIETDLLLGFDGADLKITDHSRYILDFECMF